MINETTPIKINHNHHVRLIRLIAPIVISLSLILAAARPILAQQQVFEVGAPVFSIVYYPGYSAASLGSDWLRLDGSSLSTSSYPDLFNCLGYTYGGSGATFYLPNLDGKFILSAGNLGSGYPGIGASGGEISHTLTPAEMPNHRHQIDAYADSASGSIVVRSARTGGGVQGSPYTSYVGGGQPHYNMPPYNAYWTMIKARKTTITVTVSLTQVITSTQNITLTQIVSVTQVVTMNNQIPYSVYTSTLASGDVFTMERRETYGEKYTNSLLFFICLLLILNIAVTNIRKRV